MTFAPLELRVRRGTRAGETLRFTQPVISVGRDPSSDLRFDAEREREVSARHAELRAVSGGTDGGWLARDLGSTNGTSVNGRRITTDTLLHDGDVLTLGASGPELEVRMPRTAARRRTPWLASAALAVIVVAGTGAWFLSRGGATAPTIVPPRAPNGFAAVDAANGRAVAFVASELHGQPLGGTAFAVSPEGLLVTNRHLVADGKARATRIAVKFADTPRWVPAHVVRIAAGEDDLALIQMDEPGPYPTVQRISDDTIGVAVGAPVATIGFPLADGLPMDSVGADVVARASLTAGTLSKRLPRLLQIDAFATHGSSGSPVFDARGDVVGVVWGGPPGGDGRIVYAVPAARVKEFLRAR